MHGLVQETHLLLRGIHCLLYISVSLDRGATLSARLRILDDTRVELPSGTEVCWSGHILSRTGNNGCVLLVYELRRNREAAALYTQQNGPLETSG
jgi:hypothetical protein